MRADRVALQAWAQKHEGERMDAELALKCPACDGWYPIVDDYLQVTGELAEANDTQYTLVSDELGCVQTAVPRQYLLMAHYVSKDTPLRIYGSLQEAVAIATDLEGEDHHRLRDAFPEAISPLDAPDFCGFAVLLVREDGTVGQAVEAFDRDPDAI